MLKTLRISLADKCQALFGGAVILILVVALALIQWRLQTLVEDGPRRRAEDLASMLISGQVRVLDREQTALSTEPLKVEQPDGSLDVASDRLIVSRIAGDRLDAAATHNAFLRESVAAFRETPTLLQRFEPGSNADGDRIYRYARALRAPGIGDRPGALTGVLQIEVEDQEAATQLTLNSIYSIAAGLLAGLVAIAVFWFITTRLILQPVRVLKGYAERVSEGDLSIRSDINTGDEFEQLSDVFNTMLDSLKAKQDQLAAANRSLDLELIQLAESNSALFEANRLKGEFLSHVSHELRTPLNSIVGFAEVLSETLADRTGPIDEKRKRYAQNIINSSKVLLDLINDLLDLAKIEAGKLETQVAPVSIGDMCESLITLITPLADKRDITLVVRAGNDLPTVLTDAGKLQRILFNLLSNATKFTPPRGRVSMTAEVEATPDGDAIRFRVTDTGPGIAEADQKRIFEKFTQVDNSHTREHQGTGLGLTIARDLADLLGGELTLESKPGKGATFTLVVPVGASVEAVKP